MRKLIKYLFGIFLTPKIAVTEADLEDALGTKPCQTYVKQVGKTSRPTSYPCHKCGVYHQLPVQCSECGHYYSEECENCQKRLEQFKPNS